MTTMDIEPKFSAGKVVVTRKVAGDMQNDSGFEKFCWDSLRRHVRADWGDMDDDDRMANDCALYNNERLVSVYIRNGRRIWIITERDHSVTTILYPEEY